jgi:hypothetical protein
MTGTVIRIRPRGVQASMDSSDPPTGSFNVVSKASGQTLGTVTLRSRLGKTEANFNWTDRPSKAPSVGDLIQPVAE